MQFTLTDHLPIADTFPPFLNEQPPSHRKHPSIPYISDTPAKQVCDELTQYIPTDKEEEAPRQIVAVASTASITTSPSECHCPLVLNLLLAVRA